MGVVSFDTQIQDRNSEQKFKATITSSNSPSRLARWPSDLSLNFSGKRSRWKRLVLAKKSDEKANRYFHCFRSAFVSWGICVLLRLALEWIFNLLKL